MIELFINTTSKLIDITLNNNGNISTIYKVSSMDHSTYVINIIKELLKNSNLDINSVDRLIVCNGPGSFTGIRIGIIIAKTIAYCLDIDIVTISSLELLSLNDNCLTLIHDNKDNYYYGIYENQDIKEEGLDLIDTIIEKYNEYNVSNIYSNSKVSKLDDVIIRDLDYKLLFDYCKNKKIINAHLVNPYYLKITSAEANLKND